MEEGCMSFDSVQKFVAVDLLEASTERVDALRECGEDGGKGMRGVVYAFVSYFDKIVRFIMDLSSNLAETYSSHRMAMHYRQELDRVLDQICAGNCASCH